MRDSIISTLKKGFTQEKLKNIRINLNKIAYL